MTDTPTHTPARLQQACDQLNAHDASYEWKLPMHASHPAVLTVADLLERFNAPMPVSPVEQAWREWMASSAETAGLAARYKNGECDAGFHSFGGYADFTRFLAERGLLVDGAL